MKTSPTLILIILALTLPVLRLFSVPATPYPITISQPDGTELTIRLHGDENFSYKTTLDGYALVPNTENVMTYAQMDAKGLLFSSKIKAHNIKSRLSNEKNFVKSLTPNINFSAQNQLKRSLRSKSTSTESTIQKSFPLLGSPKSLVILVNFSDKNFVTATPKVAYTSLLNDNGYSTNGGTGSARDYFMSSTYGKFSPTFDVVGPVTLPQTLDYYGKNNLSDNNNDTNPQQMIIDACAAANTAGLDFTQYDTDNNGVLDNVFVYYAGYNEAEGAAANTIWPHRWSVYSGDKFDGKTLRDYACTSELRGASGSNMCGIGTFCHEFGHVLGLVDYYHTTENKATLETWDIMDAGAYNNGGRTPPTYSAYDRFFLGYLTPKEIKVGSNLTLKPLYQGKTPPASIENQVFLFSATTHNLIGNNPNPTEFFMVEYRKKTGWDAYLPAEGMLIWHINYDASAWNANSPNNYSGTTQTASSHMRVYLQPISGSTTTPGTAFTSGSFTPTTWAGLNIKREITNIIKTADSINFKLMGGGILPIMYAPTVINRFITVQGTSSKYDSILISGKRLISNIELSFSKGLHYQLKKASDPETAWAKTLSLKPNLDSIVSSIKILVRYNPKIPSFNEIHIDSLNLKSNKAETLLVALSGVSTRTVYVVPPTAMEAKDITISSFNANWQSVLDTTTIVPYTIKNRKLAAGYKLTAYNISDGESELREGFDKGLKAPTDWNITAKDTTTSMIYSGIAVPAIQFKNTGERIETENFLLPVKKLSFFIKSLAETSGSMLVEAWNGKTWTVLENISITTSLKIKTYIIDSASVYTKFRLTFTKGNGAVSVDDIAVTFSRNLEYNARELWVNDTTFTIINAVSNRDYYYKVRASDKALNIDKSIKYENITDFSKTIQLRTLENKSKENALIATVDNTNRSVRIILPTTDVVVNVFNILGQHVKVIIPKSNETFIYDLPRNQAYILQAGNLRAKIVL